MHDRIVQNSYNNNNNDFDDEDEEKKDVLQMKPELFQVHLPFKYCLVLHDQKKKMIV